MLLKTKAIQIDLDKFRHNHAYRGIIQAYSEPCVTLAYLEPRYIQNPDIFRARSLFRTPAHSEPWYIQNLVIFRTLVYSKPEEYSGPCQISTIKCFAKIVNGDNNFDKLWLFLQNKLAAFSISWKISYVFLNTGLIFTTEVDILSKKLWHAGGQGPLIFYISIDIFKWIGLFAARVC